MKITIDQIDQDVRSILEQGKLENTHFYLPNIQLERPLYLKVNKVLEALGGKWSRKQKAHVFPTVPPLDQLLSDGNIEVVNPKKDYDFYPTPPNVVDKLISVAEIQSNHHCFEPSAGKGAIALPLSKIVGKQNVKCCEIVSEHCSLLEKEGFSVIRADFLTLPTQRVFDRVVMNPPFKQWKDHVTHGLNFLKKDGCLVTIAPCMLDGNHNIVFKKSDQQFWDMIFDHDFHTTVLPKGSFQESGTGINTMILKVSL